MIFNMTGLHLGDVLLAMPAMRAGDIVAAAPDCRVPGLQVAWQDTIQPEQQGDRVHARLGACHETDAWLQATKRFPIRHELQDAQVRTALVLAPHVVSPVKRWPMDRWLALLDELPGAVLITEHMARERWMQWLGRAHTVICPDTGTAHMADALGVPRVVALHGLGAQHYARYAPYWNRRHCIVRDAMDQITVGDVLEVLNG